MTISELIERLEAIKAEHGDLPVYASDNEFGEYLFDSVEYKVSPSDLSNRMPSGVVIG